MVEQIDYDFSKFNKIRMSQLGVAIRSMILDHEVLDFIRCNENGIIVNLGCGLDTRIERLKMDKAFSWYDLDVPEAIELRRKFFKETESVRFIAKSVFDFDWMNDIDAKNRPVLFVVEGLFMYFEETELKTLFDKIVDCFPGSEMLLETLGPKVVGQSKRHDAVKHTGGTAEFKWGIDDGKKLEAWNPQIQYVNQWNFFDYHHERVKNIIIRWLVGISYFKRNMGSRIIHLKIKNTDSEGR